jgi:hypothetical protein
MPAVCCQPASMTRAIAGMRKGARQQHGFAFEKWVASKFFSLSYTARWDIHRKMNPEGEDAGPISIKTAKWRSPIGLGDARRQFEILHNFTLVVGFWEQKGARKRIVRVVVAKVGAERWRSLWGQLTASDLDSLDRVIKNRKVDHEAAQERAKQGKARLAEKGSLIVLNPKIDSKGQRRLQCSLPFDVFFSRIVGEQNPQRDAKPTLWGELVDVVLP